MPARNVMPARNTVPLTEYDGPPSSSEEGAARRQTPSEGNNPNIALTRPQHTRLFTLVGG